MNIDTISKNQIKEFLDDNDFAGVFRQRIAAWHNHKAKLSLEVFVVTACSNEEGASCYDESVRFITGSSFEVVFNGKTYKRDSRSEAHGLVEALLEKHAAYLEEIA